MMHILLTALVLLFSVAITHAQPPEPPCNRYASWDAPASGRDGLTPATAYRPANFWPEVKAQHPTVKTLCLIEGTYTGDDFMISAWEQDGPTVPNGTASDPITIRCLTLNACTINAEGARNPVWVRESDWFQIVGLNAINGQCSNFRFSDAANSNNAVYMAVSIDAGLAINNQNSGNCMGFAQGQGPNNKCVDCAFFGSGRKGWEAISGNNALCLRCYCKWMYSNAIGPKMCYSQRYTNQGTRIFNSIANWDTQAYLVKNPDTYPTTIQCNPSDVAGQCGNPLNSPADLDQTYGHFAADNIAQGPDPNIRIYGSIAYLLPGQEYISTSNWGGHSNITSDFWDAQNIAAGFHPSALTTRPPLLLMNVSGGATSINAANLTTYGSTANTIQSQWQLGVNYFNLDAGTNPGDISSIFTSATGAQICYEYDENGVLTSNPLWPLPITEAVKALSVTHGYTQIDITADIEAAFGTIPAQCLRSEVTPTASAIIRQGATLRQNATIR